MPKKRATVTQETQKNLALLRKERNTALAEVAATHASMQPLLQSEEARIERKFGGKHPRTLRLKSQLRSNLQLAHTAAVARQLVSIDVPQVAEEAALIHGRLVDGDGLGISRLTISLAGPSGRPVPDVDEPVSDASGYFSIVLEPEALDRVIKQNPEGVFLAVFTPMRRLIQQLPKPLRLGRGARLFEEIRLNRLNLTAVPSPPTETVSVPGLTDITLKTAKRKIKAAKLALGAVTGPTPTNQSIVQKQEPMQDAKVPAGTPVNLVVREPER